MINGQDVEVFKEPVTDTGKKSKRGRLTLQMEEGVYRTFEKGTGDPDKVFRKGGRKEGKDGGRKKWEYGLDVIFFFFLFFQFFLDDVRGTEGGEVGHGNEDH